MQGIEYNGKFYEEGTPEYKQMLIIEAANPENEGSFLQAFAIMEAGEGKLFESN